MGKKRRKCRICRKNPVWRGGHVKHPGPVCKRCYHKHVWQDLPSERQKRREMKKQLTQGTMPEERHERAPDDQDEAQFIWPNDQPPSSYTPNGW